MRRWAGDYNLAFVLISWKLQRCISAAELETTTLLGVYRSSLRVCVQSCSSCNMLHTCSCVYTRNLSGTLPLLHVHAPSLCSMADSGSNIRRSTCDEPRYTRSYLTHVLGSTSAHRIMLERENERKKERESEKNRETERARHSARAPGGLAA